MVINLITVERSAVSTGMAIGEVFGESRRSPTLWPGTGTFTFLTFRFVLLKAGYGHGYISVNGIGVEQDHKWPWL